MHKSLFLVFGLCAVGGFLIGLACVGGAFVLLSFMGILSLFLAYYYARKSTAEMPVPILLHDKETGSITTVGRIVHLPQTANMASLRTAFPEPETANQEMSSKMRVEQIWSRTERDLTETFKNELSAMAMVIPKVHTAAFLMLNVNAGSFMLRASAGEGASKLIPNAQASGSGSLLGRLCREDVLRVLEGDLPGSKSLLIYAENIPLKSVVAVPVIDKHTRRGILLLDSLYPNAFSELTVETLSKFSKTFLTLSVKSYASAQNFIRQRQYSDLYSYQQTFFWSMSVKDIYEALGKYIKENIPYDRMMLLALDTNNNSYGRVVVCDGLDADYFQDREFSLSERKLDKGLVVLAISKKQLLERYFSDAEPYVVRISDDERRNINLHYMYLLPVSSSRQESSIASFAINLETVSDIAYSEHEKSLLNAIAGTAGFALERALQFEQGKDLAMKDGLTGLINHRTMHERLRSEKLRADRQKVNIGVLMMDIDHFKSVNDTYGHSAGDEIIKGIARTIVGEVRTEIDTVARYGGEEFVVALIDTTAEGLVDTAERIRAAVEKTAFDIKLNKPLHVTVSIGSYLVEPGSRVNMEKAIEFADKALYKAKENGRNRVIPYRLAEFENSDTLKKAEADSETEKILIEKTSESVLVQPENTFKPNKEFPKDFANL